jgi:hypothetical protein
MDFKIVDLRIIKLAWDRAQRRVLVNVSISIKRVEIFEQLRSYQLLKEDPAPWRQFVNVVFQSLRKAEICAVMAIVASTVTQRPLHWTAISL